MFQPASRRRSVSLALGLLTSALMLSMGGARYLNDGSFWRDEAAIAYNLITMPTLELFGRLDTGHQFPRLYLGLINQLRFVFGYETAVLRALPFGFFVVGVLVWHRVLWLRFRERPALLVLGALLTAVPGAWFAYAGMFKQYSLDVLLALLPFLLTDETLERCWRRGERPVKLLLWALPCLVSLSYGIAFLGRMSGYALGTARRHGALPPLRATAVFAAGFAAVMAASWWIDLRHAFENNAAFGYWSWRGCIATGDLVADAGLMAAWGLDWFGGTLAFSGDVGLPVWARVGLVAAFLLGAGASVAEAVRRPGARAVDDGAPDAADRARWGTRALSALATVGGLQLAGLTVSYPLCAGRLTLFAYFSLVLVVLEGFSWAGRVRASRAAWGMTSAVAVLIALASGPAVLATAERMWLRDSPENIRRLLPLIAEHPERAIVVGPCTREQVATLPEWIERDDFFYADDVMGRRGPRWPDATEFWLITTNYQFCPDWTDELRAGALRFTLVSPKGSTAMLNHVLMPGPGDAPEAHPGSG